MVLACGVFSDMRNLLFTIGTYFYIKNRSVLLQRLHHSIIRFPMALKTPQAKALVKVIYEVCVLRVLFKTRRNDASLDYSV